MPNNFGVKGSPQAFSVKIGNTIKKAGAVFICVFAAQSEMSGCG